MQRTIRSKLAFLYHFYIKKFINREGGRLLDTQEK